MVRILTLLLVFVFVSMTDGKCQWNAETNTKWIQDEYGRWIEYHNNVYEKTFVHQRTIYPGDKAVVLQQMNAFTRWDPVILDSHFASYSNTEFATGTWINDNRWEGRWANGENGYYVRVGNNWEEHRSNSYQKTFRHIQTLDMAETAVILQQPPNIFNIMTWGPVILTDHHAYYDGSLIAPGKFGVCFWRGRRANGESTEFRKVSPLDWQEYNNAVYQKTFHHVQTISNERPVVVMQQNRWVAPLVLTNEGSYYDGQKYATGTWVSSDEWQGWRIDSGLSTTFIKQGSFWTEYNNNHQTKTFYHTKTVRDSVSVAVLQQRSGLYRWAPLVLTDSSASYDGDEFSWGNWDSVDNPSVCATTAHTTTRKRRVVLDDPLLCLFRNDSHNHVVTQLRGHSGTGHISTATSRRMRMDASNAIGRLEADDLRREQQTVVREETIRIDIQGGMNVMSHGNAIRYVNIQVQTNGRNSVTIAHTNAPVNALIRDVRRALLYSLEHASLVTIVYYDNSSINRRVIAGPSRHDELK